MIQIRRRRVLYAVNVRDAFSRPTARSAGQFPVSPADSTPPDAAALALLIIRVAGSRDRQAFAALFRHFAPRVKAYLLKTGLTTPTAEELAQESC